MSDSIHPLTNAEKVVQHRHHFTLQSSSGKLPLPLTSKDLFLLYSRRLSHWQSPLHICKIATRAQGSPIFVTSQGTTLSPRLVKLQTGGPAIVIIHKSKFRYSSSDSLSTLGLGSFPGTNSPCSRDRVHQCTLLLPHDVVRLQRDKDPTS